MKHYETIFIMIPELPEEVMGQTVGRFKTALADNGSEILLADDWGRRKLAYEIKKFTKGHYILLEYLAERDAVAEMERQMRLDDNVLRYLTIKKADTFDRASFDNRMAKRRPPVPDDDESADSSAKRIGDDDENGENDFDEADQADDSDDEEA